MGENQIKYVVTSDEVISDQAILHNTGYWDGRFLDNPQPWGDEPSWCATYLMDNLPANSHVLEIGCGPMPRDTIALLADGHSVMALDEAQVANIIATENLERFLKSRPDINSSQITTMRGDIKAQKFSNQFKAITSHRTFHLIRPHDIDRLVRTLAQSLTADGLLVASFRSPVDYNEKQMELIEVRKDEHSGKDVPFTARYSQPERKDHYINFWDEVRLKTHFGRLFDIQVVHHDNEPESAGNSGTKTHFMAAVMRKRSAAEIAQYDAAVKQQPIIPAAQIIKIAPELQKEIA